MAMLDDTAIFVAIIQQGGFSRAAKHLGISNGLVSKRIVQLESKMGVTLIKRTTRQIHLTPEGELFWQYAQRAQQELDEALSLIQSLAKKPKGNIRLSASLYFGRHYLTPIIMNFLTNFPDIDIDLILSNKIVDPLKDQLDLSIRGAGYLNPKTLKDSNLRVKLLLKEKIGLYASPQYLQKYDEPASPLVLSEHTIINYSDTTPSNQAAIWSYCSVNKPLTIALKPKFSCNDIESTLNACVSGHGIARFTQLNAYTAMQQHLLCPVLSQYNWGDYHLYAVYPEQKTLPKRTRLLLEFIYSQIRNILNIK